MLKTLLRDRSAAEIVASISDAAERWSDADFPPRVRVTAAIEARLGYSTPVVDYALDRLFFPVRGPALIAAIEAEIGSLAALDGPLERPGDRATFARGVDRVTIVSSDTTIGVALIPALFALCAKCDVTVKDRSDALVSAFFETLADERPEFARAAHARVWNGGDDAAEAALLAASDVVVAFGDDASLRTIRTHLRADARFVPFAHRMSIGYIAARALAQADSRATALRGAARDAILYDGDGCLSLHALFVQGEPDKSIAQELAQALGAAALEFPGGALDAARAASVASYRNLAAFRAVGGRGAVYSVADDSVTLAIAPPLDAPPPLLPRVLPVYFVDSHTDVAAYIAQHALPIQAIGVATNDVRERELAEMIGAVRICPLGEMQSPPLGGHHGGAARIADFIRYVDAES